MNKIRVNMAVEPNDIQTLHCSQYDTEERKFTVDLHENGVGVSPSSISNQLVYKSFKGGTEQILPSNTSTPSTSPIIADIQYKDGLREDEEFLYRESPSDVDGYAKIKEIRGNTLVWNQLVQNGNFADTSVWLTNSISSFTVSNNVGTFKVSARYGNIRQRFENFIAGHKYLAVVTAKAYANGTNILLRKFTSTSPAQYTDTSIPITTTKTKHSVVVDLASNIVRFEMYIQDNNQSDWGNIEVSNAMLFDLTKMFGSGNEPSTVAEFEALFPLPYYNYTQGELLSFGENKLKFNQLVQNGNFADTSNWFTSNASFSVSNNVVSITATAQWGRITSTAFEMANAHKYLIIATVKGTTNNYIDTGIGNKYLTTDNEWETVSFIIEPTSTANRSINIGDRRSSGWTTFYAKNTMCFDLTLMFGSGNEPSTDEFLLLFPDSYYAYDSTGTVQDDNVFLRTFMNLFVKSDVQIGTNWIYGSASNRAILEFEVKPNTNYTFVLPNSTFLPNNVLLVQKQGFGAWQIRNDAVDKQVYTITTESNCTVMCIQFSKESISMGDLEGTYLFYETNLQSMLPMPITQYFPTGLKSAGSIYDQLDETGYITRVGMVDLGSLDYFYTQSTNSMSVRIDSLKKTASNSVPANILTAIGKTIPADDRATATGERIYAFVDDNVVYFRDIGYTDPTTFKNAMSGVYLYYELATPLENYGVVDLGSLTWTYESASGHRRFNSTAIDGIKYVNDTTIPNLMCSLFVADTRNHTYAEYKDMSISVKSNGSLEVVDLSYTDATTFKNAMSGIYLLYELEEPKGLTTASIVTNYGEMPLYNDNGELKADCIADVSQTSGFQIAKVKLKDENGEIYSNPFQIHTERSPQ